MHERTDSDPPAADVVASANREVEQAKDVIERGNRLLEESRPVYCRRPCNKLDWVSNRDQRVKRRDGRAAGRSLSATD